MTQKRPHKAKDRGRDDPEQSKRFIETAEQVGADDEEALERAFKKIAPEKPTSQKDRQS